MNGLVLPDRCFATPSLSLLPHRRTPLWTFSSSGLQCTTLVDQELGKCPCQTFLGYGFSQCFIPLSALSGAGFPCVGRNVKMLEAAGRAGASQLPRLREPQHRDPGHPSPGITSVSQQRQAQAALSNHLLKITALIINS